MAGQFAPQSHTRRISDSMNARLLYRLSPYLACFLACAVINLAYFPPATTFPDEQRLLASAVHLVATGDFSVGADRAWEMPGPALFFSPAVWLFGPHDAIIPLRFVQALLVLVQCGLVATIVRRVFNNPRVAFVGAWLTAVYPFILFYQGLLLSETLFNTFLLAGMAALFWWRDRGLRVDGSLLLVTLFFAAATMSKATLTILPPLLLALTAWLCGIGWRRTAAILVAASTLYAACMSPWWIRNAMVLHAFVPFTTGSAQNLYLGNNPRNTDAGIAWDIDAEPEVVAKINALPDELARQRAFSKAAMDYITAHPVTFITMAGKKFLRLWNIVPNAAEFRTGLYSIISAASFGPILALALLSALRWRLRWRELAPLYLVIAYFTFVHVVTIASLRYRLPIEPLLIVLAAEPLSALIETMRATIVRRFQQAA